MSWRSAAHVAVLVAVILLLAAAAAYLPWLAEP